MIFMITIMTQTLKMRCTIRGEDVKLKVIKMDVDAAAIAVQP